MTETVGYGKIHKEDLSLGTGTTDVTLPDGKSVALTQINIAELLNPSGKVTLTVGSLLLVTSATTVSILPAVATGYVLASAGLVTAPAYSATPTVTTLTCQKLIVTDSSGNVLHCLGAAS